MDKNTAKAELLSLSYEELWQVLEARAVFLGVTAPHVHCIAFGNPHPCAACLDYLNSLRWDLIEEVLKEMRRNDL